MINLTEQDSSNQTVQTLRYFLVVIVVAGAIGNVLLFVSLTRLLRSRRLSSTAGRFMRLQAVLDAACCVLLLLVVWNDPAMPLPTVGQSSFAGYFLALLICNGWYTQYPLWAVSVCSVYNLVLLSVDRCIAIRLPMHHRRFAKRGMVLWCTAMLFSIVFAVPLVFMTQLQPHYNNQTHSENGSDTGPVLKCVQTSFELFPVYCVAWVTFDYFVPSVTMLVTYGIMIHTLVRTSHEELDATKVARATKSRATRQLVKIVVIAGSTFILCFLQDNMVTLLSAVHVMDYVFNSPLQIIGALCQGVNFSINPFLIFLLMPLTRYAFCRDTRRRKSTFRTSSPSLSLDGSRRKSLHSAV